jgi:hypothetical protein
MSDDLITAAHTAAYAQWKADGGDIDGPSESVIQAAIDAHNAAIAAQGDVTDDELWAATDDELYPHERPGKVRALMARQRAVDAARIAELEEENARLREWMNTRVPVVIPLLARAEAAEATVERVRAVPRHGGYSIEGELTGMVVNASDLNAALTDPKESE